MAGAPLFCRDPVHYLVDVFAAAGPGGLAACLAVHRSTHAVVPSQSGPVYALAKTDIPPGVYDDDSENTPTRISKEA